MVAAVDTHRHQSPNIVCRVSWRCAAWYAGVPSVPYRTPLPFPFRHTPPRSPAPRNPSIFPPSPPLSLSLSPTTLCYPSATTVQYTSHIAFRVIPHPQSHTQDTHTGLPELTLHLFSRPMHPESTASAVQQQQQEDTSATATPRPLPASSTDHPGGAPKSKKSRGKKDKRAHEVQLQDAHPSQVRSHVAHPSTSTSSGLVEQQQQDGEVSRSHLHRTFDQRRGRREAVGGRLSACTARWKRASEDATVLRRRVLGC